MNNIKINSAKIWKETQLINTCLQKENNLSYLLGAGCSKDCDIPLGNKIMEICQKYSYINQSENANELCMSSDFYNYEIIKEQVQEFISSNFSDFKEFVKTYNDEIYNKIDDTYLINKLPKHFKKNLNNTTYEKEELKKLIFNDCLYGEWFEKFGNTPRDRQRLIEYLIDNKTPSWGYVLFAHLVKEKFIKNIFTTNFDDLINEALMYYYSIRARVYSHNEEAYYISVHDSKPNIIKLHGDYLFENLKNTGSETNKLDPNMEEKFSEALKLRSGLVIIGYAGADNSIMSILYEMKKHNYSLYWCDINIENLNWRVKDLINNTDSSYLIKINSFDNFICKLWNKSNLEPLNFADTISKKQSEYEAFINRISDDERKPLNESKFKGYEYINIANNYYKLKEFGTAIENYNNAIKLIPNLSELYNLRGNVYLEIGDFEKAILDFNKAIELEPNNYSFYNNRCTSNIEIYNYKNAYEDAVLALELNPNSAAVYGNIANIYNGIKNYEEAKKYYFKSLKINPEEIESLENLANTFCRLEDYYNALAYYEKRLELDPTDASTYSNRAFAFKALGDYDECMKDCNISIKLNYKYWKAYVIKAALYLKSGNYKQAEYEYTTVVSIQKDQGLSCLTELFLFTKKYEKGLQKIKELKKLKLNKGHNLIVNMHEALILLMMNKSYEMPLNEITKQKDGSIKIDWDFTDIKEWLKEIEITENKRNRIYEILSMMQKIDDNFNSEIEKFVKQKNEVLNKDLI